MIKHIFKVRQSEDSPEHEVTVQRLTFAEATEKQREAMFEEGMSSATIKVQGTCRRRLAKGVRGEALNAEAQAAFKAIWDGTPASRVAVVVVDAAALKLTREQALALQASGATVANIPDEA